MAKLHFSLDGNSLGEFDLGKERTTIGRRPANDIHIDNLAVSGDHAVITTIGNDSFLEDLNSTNGTLVNKKPVKKHVLHHGDIIEFGKYQLKYVNKMQENRPVNSDGFENTVVVRPAKLVVSAPEIKAEPEVEVVVEKSSIAPAIESVSSVTPEPIIDSSNNTQKLGYLRVLSGDNSGRELSLNKSMTTLGKPGVQVAVITKRPHGYFISHVEGEKQLLVNGRNAGEKAYELSDRDVIDLIGTQMEFYLV
jgi:pSer/pThr/pTyr-binding forkhead associated (FHA) protein